MLQTAIWVTIPYVYICVKHDRRGTKRRAAVAKTCLCYPARLLKPAVHTTRIYGRHVYMYWA